VFGVTHNEFDDDDNDDDDDGFGSVQFSILFNWLFSEAVVYNGWPKRGFELNWLRLIDTVAVPAAR